MSETQQHFYVENSKPPEQISLAEKSVIVIENMPPLGKGEKSTLSDLPEVAEAIGNPQVVGKSRSTKEAYVVKTTQGTRAQFHMVEANGEQDKQLIFTQQEISLDSVTDSEMLQALSQSVLHSMYDDFQGQTHAKTPAIDFNFHNVSNCPLDDTDEGNTGFFGGWEGKRRSNTRKMPLQNWLNPDELRRIGVRKDYAIALGLSFNSSGQFVIQGAGYMSQDFCGRAHNPSAFFLVLERNTATEKLMAVLANEAIAERKKREILGAIFELHDASFPKQASSKTIAKNYFFNQPEVHCIVANRLKLPRVTAKKLESENSGEFCFDNIADAIDAEVQFRFDNKHNNTNFHAVATLERKGEVHLEPIQDALLAGLKRALDIGAVESSTCDDPHVTTADGAGKDFIQWKPEKYPEVTLPLTIDHTQTAATAAIREACKLLKAIQRPPVAKGNTYDLSDPHHLYVPKQQRVTLDIRGSVHLQLDLLTEVTGLLSEVGLKKAALSVDGDVAHLLNKPPKDLENLVLVANGAVDAEKAKGTFAWLLSSGAYTGTVTVDASVSQSLDLRRLKLRVLPDKEGHYVGPTWLFPKKESAQQFVNNHKKIPVYWQSEPGKFERVTPKLLGNLFA